MNVDLKKMSIINTFSIIIIIFTLFVNISVTLKVYRFIYLFI